MTECATLTNKTITMKFAPGSVTPKMLQLMFGGPLPEGERVAEETPKIPTGGFPQVKRQEVRLVNEIKVEVVQALASDEMVAQAARVSTKGSGAASGAHRGLIRALMREHHGSPFEHNLFGFRIHVPRSVEIEHVRHRAGWSYNWESARYRTMEPEFWCPPAHRPIQQVGKAMDYNLIPGQYPQQVAVPASIKRVAAEAYAEYEYLLNLGVAREVARNVLPINLMVTGFVTCNARSLMHFLALRTSDGDSKPLWEIEQVARAYELAFSQLMPETYAAFQDYGRVAP